MITHVAIQSGNGFMYALPRPMRHHDIIRVHLQMRKPLKQGFIDSLEGFVDHERALVIALRGKQLTKAPIAPPNLYSEDLW